MPIQVLLHTRGGLRHREPTHVNTGHGKGRKTFLIRARFESAIEFNEQRFTSLTMRITDSHIRIE